MNNASASVAGRTQEHPLLWRSLSLASTDLVFLVVQAEGRAEKHDPDLSPFITLPPPPPNTHNSRGLRPQPLMATPLGLSFHHCCQDSVLPGHPFLPLPLPFAFLTSLVVARQIPLSRVLNKMKSQKSVTPA